VHSIDPFNLILPFQKKKKERIEEVALICEVDRLSGKYCSFNPLVYQDPHLAEEKKKQKEASLCRILFLL